MTDHYVITADRGHLRIFRQRQDDGQSTPTLDEVQAEDFPAGIRSYVYRDTDMAGRFQGSNQPGPGPGIPTGRPGMSIDERLPMQREEDRRQIRDLAAGIEEFLAARPDASWDFAAGREVHNVVLETLSPGIRGRLRQSIAKDLVHQPPADVCEHFAPHPS